MRRHIKQYQSLSHTNWFAKHPAASHFFGILARATPAHRKGLQPLLEYLPGAVWEWFIAVARYVFKPKHPFPGADQAPQNSHYTIPNFLRVSIAGDWGTGTEEAHAVATEMMKWEDDEKPDLTIHIGDVYFVGGKEAVEQNCLNKPDKIGKNEGVQWPSGRMGSFALNGNHEMYARGYAYFDNFLPTLGMKGAASKGQGTSFFCLENDYWRVVAVDTGYNSISLVSKPTCELPEPLISWLAGIIPADDQKATILISHQQYYSAFDDNFALPARQLSRFFNKWPVLWLWGHEHRSTAYDLYKSDGVNLAAYGRCIGHGGMPVEINPPGNKPGNLGPLGKLLFSDRRKNPIYHDDKAGSSIGINGFAQLLFDDRRLTIRHKSLVCGNAGPDVPSYPSSETLLTESFVCDGPEIKWEGFHDPVPQIDGLYVHSSGNDPKSL